MSTTDFRAMCAELVDLLDCFSSTFNIPIETSVVTRARALLAQQPVSPPYKLPEPEGPTDEELISSIMWMLDDCVYDNDRGEIAQSLRRLIACFGRPTPQPVADGEVGELVEWLQSMRDLAGEHNPDEQRRYTRAAELLERPTPQPVAVSERLPGPEDCIQRDNDHWCWGQERSFLTGQAAARWRMMRVSSLEDEAVNWLPANALPTPEAND